MGFINNGMRKFFFILFLIAPLLSASAQTYPNFPELPANTVIGRVGNGQGLAEAVDMATLAAGLNLPGGTSGEVQTNNGDSGFAGITDAQLTALINEATTSASGAVPAIPNSTSEYLRGDLTWATPTSASPQICDIISTSATTCNNGGSAADDGTYTVPSGAVWLEVTLVGGGGGGSGGGSSPGSGGAGNGTCWNTSGSACTSPVYEAGGGGAGTGSAGGAQGTISGSGTCGFSVAGGAGNLGGSASYLSTLYGVGGTGGNSSLGGAGAAEYDGAGGNAAANSGSGGGAGASTDGSTLAPTGGGGAGATCKVIITSPGSSYTYAVGASASGGTAGTDGEAGGTGAAGHITVIAHF